MSTIPTHMYRVRAILALLLFLSSASLWAQSDDATLTNITNLEQLHAIRYDLNGDGMVDASASMADSISYETAFSLARKGSITCTGGCSGYELMNDLDFEDANGDGTANAPRRSCEGNRHAFLLPVPRRWAHNRSPANPPRRPCEGSYCLLPLRATSRKILAS